VKPADEVETVVLSVNPADRRISLGMKQLLDNPWENLTSVSGRAIVEAGAQPDDFGAFHRDRGWHRRLGSRLQPELDKRVKHLDPLSCRKKDVEKISISFHSSSPTLSETKSRLLVCWLDEHDSQPLGDGIPRVLHPLDNQLKVGDVNTRPSMPSTSQNRRR